VRYCEKCGAAFQYARSCPKDGIATTAGAFDPLLGRVLGDRYRILDRIGAGGMGQVYRAAHTRIACVFAVKVVWGDLAYDQEMQSRFVREAELASCLQSRHIVRVVDFSQDSGSLPYLVMEHLDGPSVFDLLARSGALAPQRAGLIAQRIARGLAHAHERGVVHRDMKPDNVILVSEDEETDVVKILDFGVARLRDGERLTSSGVAIGTPIYMAPEQFLGGELDGRADLYALGVVLFEMITGKPPFSAPNLLELGRQHMQVAPASVRPQLEAAGSCHGLEEVVRRLLAKKPEERYASAREVVSAIGEAIAGVARASMPPSRASRRPPLEPRVVGALRHAIVTGAPTYNAGDHHGCYDLYRTVAQELVGTAIELAAVSARLQAGLSRAASRTIPTASAWDMRNAFDDLLEAQPFLATGDAVADELAAFASISAHREALGQLALMGDYQIAFARALAARLRPEARHGAAVVALEQAALRGEMVGGGESAVQMLEPVLASLRAAGAAAPVSLQALSARPVSVPPVASVASALRPSLPGGPQSGGDPPEVPGEVREKIARAIEVGAPAYNDGHPDVCERIYRETASRLVSAYAQDSQDRLKVTLSKALDDARGRPVTEAAWILRHAFDTVLAWGG